MTQRGSSAGPVLILVSGSPGSGKTTLARLLADELALPHLNKDRIRDGMRFTSGSGTTEEQRVWSFFCQSIERVLEEGISLVADFTTYRGLAEKQLPPLLPPNTQPVNIHCRSSNALDRFATRMPTHPQLPWDAERAAIGLEMARKAEKVSRDPAPFGWPVLEVGTTEEYEPRLDEVCRWVLHEVGRTLPLAAPRRFPS